MFPIWLVDDSREDLKLCVRILQQCQILNPVDLILGGEECIDALKSIYAKGANRNPPLILMDLAMPVMNGIQTIAQINELQLARPPWIVMMSGMAELKMVREGYALGARTFFTKPLQCPEVLLFLRSNEASIIIRPLATGLELHWA